MKSAKVVIGANFGDEGKGNATNYLSKDRKTTVVRFNGGAQAGHTVCMPDGRRHVFGHIGSGTFKYATTHLSRFFICNPLLFVKEYNKLEMDPLITADPRCLVTTHYDMIINQMIEEYRTSRHGSCGVGINETLNRSKIFPLRISSLKDPKAIVKNLSWIRYEYFEYRLKELGIPREFYEKHQFYNDDLLDHIDVDFELKCREFKYRHYQIEDDDIVNNETIENIVFEGAQGLLLDQDHEYFPHVTHSKTGLDNVLEIIKGSIIDHLDVYYISRTYLTRHGRGPFPTEGKLKYEIKDETNIPNPWQESIRTGTLDAGLLSRTIGEQSKIPRKITDTFNLFLTCADQSRDIVRLDGIDDVDINSFFNLFYDNVIISRSPEGPNGIQ